MMKKLCLTLLLIVFLICFAACGESGDTTAESSTAAQTTEPTVQGTPTYVYSYTAKDKASFPTESIDAGGILVYRPSVSEPDRNLFFADSVIYNDVRGRDVDFLGETVNVGLVNTYASFPMYPVEFGAYSVYSYYNSLNDRGTAHIRHDTEKPIYLHGRNETIFQTLDLEDRDAVVAFATEMLKRYTSFEGYTLFVYEDKVFTQNGIVVEYNLTVDGQKTNCFAQMGIGYNRLDYMIRMTNDIESVIKPYTDAKVDVQRLNAVVEDMTEQYYCSDPYYVLDSYEFRWELMVLNRELMAYITICPTEMYLSQEGMEAYGFYDQGYLEGERRKVTPLDMMLLVEIASIEYVTE